MVERKTHHQLEVVKWKWTSGSDEKKEEAVSFERFWPEDYKGLLERTRETEIIVDDVEDWPYIDENYPSYHQETDCHW